MQPIESKRIIKAPVDRVFAVISDVRNFAKAVPHIVKTEFLTQIKVGEGTKFRETRLMRGKEQSVVIEVAGYELNKSIRMVSDEGGTVWDSVFRVEERPEGTELSLRMDIVPHTLLAKVATPLIRSMVQTGVDADIDAVKAYCESDSHSSAT